MRTRLLALTLLLPCLGLAAPLSAAHLYFDREGLHEGAPGTHAWVEVPLVEVPEAGRRRDGVEGWGLRVGDAAHALVAVHELGPALRLEFFHALGGEPWRGHAAATPVALSHAGTEVATWTLAAGSRGSEVLGEAVLVPVAEGGEGDEGDGGGQLGLAARWLPPYLQVVPEPVRDRLEAVGSRAEGALWFDLGRVAHRRGELVAAAYGFARAADAYPEDPLPVTWLARTWLRVAPHDGGAIAAIEASLAPRVEALAEAAVAAEAEFRDERAGVRAAEKKHGAEFQAVRKQLQELPRDQYEGAAGEALAARLDAIQREVDAAGAALRARLGRIERPTPAMLRALVNLRLGLSRLGEEGAWIERAHEAAELAYQGRFHVVPVDRTLRARVLLRRAALAHAEGVPAEAAYQALPEVAELARLEARYAKDKETVQARRAGVDDAVKALADAPELAALRSEIDAAKARYQQAREKYEGIQGTVQARQQELRRLEAAYRKDPSEENKAAAEAAVEAFNALVPRVNELAEVANAAAEAANAANLAYADGYNAAATASTAEFDAAVLALNGLVDDIRTLEADLKQPRDAFQNLLFRRDEALALAKDELHRQLGERPGRAAGALLEALDTAVPVPSGATRIYQGRPWCQSVSLACDQCFGLAVLGCEFAQMDARSACERGEEYETLLDRSWRRGGGIIGACRGVRAPKPEQDRWTIDPDDRHPTRRPPADDVLGEVGRRAFDHLLGPAFDPSPSCGAGALPDQDEGLPLDFSEAVRKAIEEAHERWRQDQARQARLARLEADLAALDEARELRRDPELKDLSERLAADPEDPELRRRFATKLAARAAHVAEAGRPGPGASGPEWVEYAKQTSEMAKKANDLVERIGGEKIPGVEKLTELADQVTGIIEAAEKGDASAMTGHVGDFLKARGVPVPYDLPMTVVGANLDYTREGFEGATNTLESMSEAMSSDDPAAREAALNRMVKQSQELQETLSGKRWAEKVKKNLLSKIPFYDKAKAALEEGKRVLGGIVDFFTGGDDSCQAPPPPMSDEFALR